ncbi:MAG: urate hydroxylase PuuD [Acidobacteriota bacterium]
MSEWLNLIFRWAHVIAGVMWIGHLWFFNFVNSQLAKTYDADSKRKVVPELMPRALYWFRWGAAWTWITGILLLGIVYYMGGSLMAKDSELSVGAGTAISLAILVVGFLVYDTLWNTPVKKSPFAGTVISVLLLAGVSYGLGHMLSFSARAVSIHVGALFGTSMAANVWMRIWPAQKKIIASIAAGNKPDPALAAVAGMRSKHNTYMSLPLLALMTSNHYPLAYGWKWSIGLVVIGFVISWLLYKKAASAAPARY